MYDKKKGGFAMKKLACALTLMAAFVTASHAGDSLSNITYQKSVVNSVLTTNQNFDLDLSANNIDSLSVQVVYSSASPVTTTFIDGVQSTGSILVGTLAALTTAYATDNLTVLSTNNIAGACLTINGYPMCNGSRTTWRLDVTSDTAVDINSDLNANYGTVFVSTVQPGSSIVYSTAANYGSAGNAITYVSAVSTAMSIASGNFTGGQDNATINIGGYILTANKDWFPTSSTSTTASNISKAIDNSALSSFVASSASASGIITTTANVVGTIGNYSVTTSTIALLASGTFLTGGKDSDVVITQFNPSSATVRFNALGTIIYPGGIPLPLNGTIKKPPTNFGVAEGLLLTTTAGVPPSNIFAGTTYYATNLTTTGFQLASSTTNAVAGTAISITTTTVTGGGTFVLTPLAISGTASWVFQKSDDDVNFYNIYASTQPTLVPIATSTSFASAYTASNAFWELGNVAYRWLRLAYTSVTTGGVNFNYIVNGKKN